VSTIGTKHRRTMIGRAIERVRPRRALWRQRLVDAETGFKLFLRADSALFVHLFVGAAVVIAGLLLDLTRTDWLLLVLGMTGVLTAELFQCALQRLADALGAKDPAKPPNADVQRVLRIANAGVMTALAGAVLCVAVLFGSRLVDLFG
jgi:diacylglycerol kinase (ATP)